MDRSLRSGCIYVMFMIISFAAYANGEALATPGEGCPREEPGDKITERELAGIVKAFARARAADDQWGTYVDGERCRSAGDITYVAFHADGTPRCTLEAVPEGHVLEVRVLVPDSLLDKYSISITYGATPATPLLVRGSLGDIKKAADKITSFMASEPPTPVWAVKRSSRLKSSKLSVTIELAEAGISVAHTFQVEHVYPINLTLVAAGRASDSTYSVVDGVIAESNDTLTIDYIVGVPIYPFAWRNMNGKTYYGRYFSSRDTFWHRIALVPGVSLASPSEHFYLGAAVEILPGVALSGGWQPHKAQALKAGYAVGEAFAASDAPVEKRWTMDSFGGGLMVDAVLIAKALKILD